ncbi:MAG: 30S ribosomal protein S3 [Puniceicoccales bacterium]|jgi:small subunit ribosomal protein S3|nr:30S ribosomal protein S3 [Puniceicoccales bacterium]
MGQKTNPIGLRLSIRRDWESRWFATGKDYATFLKEDYVIRRFLRRKVKFASCSKIFIERAGDRVRVKIHSARPGLIIGRRGQDLEKLSESLKKIIRRDVLLDVQEIKRPDLEATLVAEGIAVQLERRISFRRALKKAVQTSMALGAEGIRVQCSGRLGGTEIARSESQRAGRVPLHTLKEHIDYGFAEAKTVYGVIGVKCWICHPQEESSAA